MTSLILVSVILLMAVLSFRSPVIALSLLVNTYILSGVISVILKTSVDLVDNIIGNLGYIVVSCVIIFTFIRSRSSIKLNLIDTIIIIWSTYSLISMLWSPDTSIAISYNIKLLLFITLLYFYGRIIFSFAEKAESIKKMINEYLYSTWIISLIASLTAIVFGGGTSQRLSIGDINPIPLGILLSCGLLSAFILLSNAESNNTRHRYWKFIITLSIFVISYTAIASNNRGPLISLAISTVIFIGARYKFTNPIPAIKISSLLAIAIAAAYYLLNTYFSEIIERTLYGFSLALNLIDNSSSGNLGESLDIRLDLWESAWKIFSNNPIIGVGAGGYSSLSFFDYPHNLTLEILSLYGIIGLAFMLTLIAMTIRKFIIGYIYDNLQIIGMGCLLLMTFLESQISLAMWMNKHMIVYLAILSAAIISRHQWSKGRRND